MTCTWLGFEFAELTCPPPEHIDVQMLAAVGETHAGITRMVKNGKLRLVKLPLVKLTPIDLALVGDENFIHTMVLIAGEEWENAKPPPEWHLSQSLQTYVPGKPRSRTMGKYSPEERAKAVARYKEKRASRNFKQRVTYKCRSDFARHRMRIGGVFPRLTPEIKQFRKELVGSNMSLLQIERETLVKFRPHFIKWAGKKSAKLLRLVKKLSAKKQPAEKLSARARLKARCG